MNSIKRHRVLILSGFVNLLLGGLLFFLLRPAAEDQLEPAAVREPAVVPVQQAVSSNSRPLGPAVTNEFRWNLLESTNLQVYAANLRASGCPENTVQDIIVAAVERLYAARRSTTPLGAGFWSCGPKREAATREREQINAALESEQRDLLLAVVGKAGSDPDQHSSRDFVELAIMHFLLGPVPDGTAEQVLEAVERGSELEGQVRNQAGGLLLPADKARLEEVKRQTLAEVQGLLTPDQFEEFAARETAMGLLDNKLHDLRVTPAELRAIALIHISVLGARNEIPFRPFRIDEGPDAWREEFEMRMRALLGDARFALYLGQGSTQGTNPAEP